MTIPTQLRRMVAEDGRDLVDAFRALAPPRAPISIQRWTIRRLTLVAALVGGVVLAVWVTWMNLKATGLGWPNTYPGGLAGASRRAFRAR